MRWLLAVNAALLIVLIITGLVNETSAEHRTIWRRLFRRTQGWLVSLAAACWAWLTTTVVVLYLARDPHAETAGWLLLGIMLLSALPMILDLEFAQAAQLCLIVMVFVAYGVGMIAVDQRGSPEELHRDREGHRVEHIESRTHPMPAHAR
ncbi:hypothetical protein [Sphaerisporangium corydalis]|uniref:Uncharacterized protein n=1 Tax=Sphaerisporangium corydalis TaxID=1441875 RepID=A0ABV9ENB2_9ACTN|nr:hypothetical protein [Sphaerisporangium corydalis]